MCRVIISTPIKRIDDPKAMLTLSNLCTQLKKLKIDLVDNGNINENHIGKKGFHMNGKGVSKLALNFLNFLNKIMMKVAIDIKQPA